MPTLDQTLVLAILTAMVALFVWDRLRYDLVALLGLLAAMASGSCRPTPPSPASATKWSS